MEWDVLLAFVAGSGAVGAGATWMGERLRSGYDSALRQSEERMRSDLARVEEAHRRALATRSVIDLNLRDLRLPAYKELWGLTSVLPRWPRAEKPLAEDRTYEDLREFSGKLRDWYFKRGGWLLSHEARDSYGKLQETMWDTQSGLLWDQVPGGIPNLRTGRIEQADYDAVMERCSWLRSQLTEDLESRLAGPITDGPTTIAVPLAVSSGGDGMPGRPADDGGASGTRR